MKLENKKFLAAKALKVGVNRVRFNRERLAEVKEAITKQDILDLSKDGAIKVIEIKGTKTRVKRKTRRRKGSIKIKVKTKKQEYMAITRKLRAYLKTQRDKEKINPEIYSKLRKEIRARKFKSLAQMKDRIANWS